MALTALREMRGTTTLEALAADVEISVSQLSRYESGKRDPSLAHLKRLSDHFGVTVGELIGDVGVKSVPIVSWVSAGKLRSSHPVFDSDVLREVAAANLPAGRWIALEIDGDSMNLIAPPGSLIIVNRDDNTLVDSRFYVFGNTEGEATFKRFRRNPDRLQPYSTNPEHETHYMTDEMIVIGRAYRVINNI